MGADFGKTASHHKPGMSPHFGKHRNWGMRVQDTILQNGNPEHHDDCKQCRTYYPEVAQLQQLKMSWQKL